jgi:hypothetical protein
MEMTRDPLEVLSALLDGEPVEAEVLAAALLAPGAREALVDFARLRGAVADDDARPSPAFYAAMTAGLSAEPRRRSVAWRVARGLAAAVVLALAGLGAASLPSLRQPAAEEPPRATRVLRFTPGVDWTEGGVR